jgi:hypothetical protein
LPSATGGETRSSKRFRPHSTTSSSSTSNHPSVIDAYVELDLASQNHPDGARNMGKNDLWIAACAKAGSATLLTTDNDFSHLIPDHLDGEVIDPAVVLRDDSE